jgi:hypothetical protein
MSPWRLILLPAFQVRNDAVPPQYALSVKQPWAGLLVLGHKIIEVRRWAHRRRGRVLIHAAGVRDEREEAWQIVEGLVAPDQGEWLLQDGGILGVGEITECREYRTLEQFLQDQPHHLNPPAWFEPPMYGFVFRNAGPVRFQPLQGQVRFFTVPDDLVVPS